VKRTVVAEIEGFEFYLGSAEVEFPYSSYGPSARSLGTIRLELNANVDSGDTKDWTRLMERVRTGKVILVFEK